MSETNPKPIIFHFAPFNFDSKEHCVEKAEGDKKRRYLKGVSSGIKVDGHGERMTMKAINSFQRQAKSGDILLYEGQHGVDYTDDIGRLVDSAIMPDGNWMTTYRLYDEQDGMGPVTLEKADKLWRQVNGLPPYTRPKQKGFSIEGDIPEDGILSMDESGKRMIDDVVLMGTVVVPRPAYQDSVAQAVYKALGLESPYKIRKMLSKGLAETIDQKKVENEYFNKRMEISDTLDEIVKGVMTDNTGNEKERLEQLFDEYKGLIIPLILQSKGLFLADSAPEYQGNGSENSPRTKDQVFTELGQYIDVLLGIRNRLKKGG
jgi:hypothetical protein